MKCMIIDENRGEYAIEKVAEILGISASAYYYRKKHPLGKREIETIKLTAAIKDIFFESWETYGSPRVTEELKKNGWRVSRGRVSRIMQENNWVAKAAAKYVITTDSSHKFPASPNRLKQNFVVKRPGMAWVSDVTYLKTEEGWMYLCTVIDLYNRGIVGWSLEDNLTAEIAIKAMKVAWANHRPSDRLIFHSDRGIQYACHEFRKVLKGYGFKQSMSRKGNCWDNAPAESFFHTLKTEEVRGQSYRSKAECRLKIFEYIEIFYNRRRMHSSLGYKTPFEFEQEYLRGCYWNAA
ncbi:MAG: IS3 family transposase [Candidatus Wallbacteria bacterium]|nr:IS3 family transposase [Candidatus Wallbacteria bacterium]